jgi:7,8-dihydropterin-6-yl-methyl-4-(beta-D-ribofuranosyl)aminobenzene 5'-phosphate synthase
MKLIVLTENTTADAAIGCEHGLSLYIETNGRRLLFDMGQTALFAENAQKLGVDLSKIDYAVLSHGHYDHGGGLQTFLTRNTTAPVFLSRYAFEPHYNGTEKYIGLNTALQSSERLVFTGEAYRIADGLKLFSCNERTRPFDFGSANLNVKQNGVLMPEDYRHEQYLLIEEDGRRILISGCSHKGILNILEWFHPDVLVGGFHFMKLPCDKRLKGYAEQLNRFDTEYYTCHCTGIAQYDFMQPLTKKLHYLSAGQTIKI